ncbi:MAG: phosphate ABC transporter permease PstA [Candidatus Odinarchaeia archaeon]
MDESYNSIESELSSEDTKTISKNQNKNIKEKLGFWFFRVISLIPLFFLFWIIVDLVIHGFTKLIEPGFLTTPPEPFYTGGGILPAIIGTMYVMIFTLIFSLPLGILSAVYLTEYAKESTITRIIRKAITTLAAIPSIVYGVFGYAFFVLLLNLGASIISGALTLSLLTLPVIITSSQEAILAVPKSYREASLALGASKWETIWHHVLPSAFGGILTGAILGLGRAAGETAPILFMAIDWSNTVGSIFDQFMALPVTIYKLAGFGIDTLEFQYATALTLLILVLTLNIVAIILRAKFRRELKKIRT